MKKLCPAILASLFLFTAISCSDDPDDKAPPITPIQLFDNVTDGSWRITLFSEDGTVKTENFNGYSFIFQSNSVLTANSGSNTYIGNWGITLESNTDDNPDNDLDFNIAFTAPDAFVSLSDDWDVLQTSATKLQLRHVSGGDGSVDLLTFEKNQ